MTNVMTMNVSFPKKSLSAALLMMLLLMAARTITIMYRMTWAPAPASMITRMHVSEAVPAQPTPATSAENKTVVAAASTDQQLNGLSLNSTVRSYQMVINGQVVCGSKPCPAHLQVSMSSSRNPDLREMIETNSDGTYQVVLAFKELPHEQIDWRVTAMNDAMGTAENHGRQILTDDSVVALEDNTLQIHS